MIITSINAQNVLKYEELKLNDLPEKGIIAISGLNESGKSSIGETVCFALFGKTFSVAPQQIKKIIRWGEETCSVTLTFKVDDQEYSLYRLLDTFGNHSAKLSLVGSEKTPLARSPKDVDDAIAKLLGYDYDEFIESFYLAQREITSPHPHSTAIKAMAGVSALEQASADFKTEIRLQQEMLKEAESESETLRGELDELAFEEGYLETLEDEKQALETDLQNTKALSTELDSASQTYINNENKIKTAKSKKWRSQLFSFISLLLALGLGAVWGLITQKSDLPQAAQLLEKLQQYIPNWQPNYADYIGIAAAVFIVFSLFFWLRSGSHKKQTVALSKESAKLSTVMPQLQSVAEYELDTDNESTDSESTEQFEHNSSEDISMRFDTGQYSQLLPAVESVSASASNVSDYSKAEQKWLSNQIALREENHANVSAQVEEEQARLRQFTRLHEMETGLQTKCEQLTKKLSLREIAVELLAGAGKHFSNKFNRDIQDIMSTTLPVFTQNRYEHLRMEADFSIQVFSNDKLGFLDLEEISSGTQRQIMLALRLALSRKLMARAVHGKQFAFLDEPFAFFDAERTKHALLALEKLNDTLSQIWIVSQKFPEGHEFAARIDCSREIEALIYETS